MELHVTREELPRSRRVYIFARKSIDFPLCCLLAVCKTRVRGQSLARLPYDLARIGGAEPYLAHVTVFAEVVELLGVRVLPAARDTSSKSYE